MDDNHRTYILNHVDSLISLTEYTPLIDECVKQSLLTKLMRLNIENHISIDTTKSEEDILRQRHKLLFRKLTKRGPEAFVKLKHVLVDLGYDRAVQLLHQVQGNEEFVTLHGGNNNNHNNNNNHVNHTQVANKTPVNNNISNPSQSLIGEKLVLREIPASSVEDADFVVKPATYLRHDPFTYPSDEQADNRGIFFMVNMIEFANNTNEKRNGAQEDAKALLYLFKKLGFKLYAYDNLTKMQFTELLKELVESENARKTNCFVMALMTRCLDENDVLQATFYDGQNIPVDEITDQFANSSSTNLKNKPKVLLYNFCRGDRSDVGYSYVETDSESKKAPKPITHMHSKSDILVCFSVLPDLLSHHDPNAGSWYIQNFCKLVAEHAHEEPLEDILKRVQNETGKDMAVDGMRQMSNYTNIGFNKKLYFYPGI